MPKMNEAKEFAPRAKLEEGAYTAIPVSVDGPIDTTYDGVPAVKLILLWKTSDGHDLQQFVNNAITPASNNFSASNLYLALEKFGMIKEFMAKKAELLDDTKFVAWMNAGLKAKPRKYQVVVKNSNKGSDKEYSTVREILKAL